MASQISTSYQLLLKEDRSSSNQKNLRNIATGVLANENFKVNQAGETGKNVLKLTENQTAAEFSF